MDKSTMQEIGAIWDKFNELDKKLSDFIDSVHGVSTAGISENQDSILDVADLSDENSTSIVELADMVEDLEGRVKALEEK